MVGAGFDRYYPSTPKLEGGGRGGVTKQDLGLHNFERVGPAEVCTAHHFEGLGPTEVRTVHRL